MSQQKAPQPLKVGRRIPFCDQPQDKRIRTRKWRRALDRWLRDRLRSIR